jgi:NodT family efflux transporter outer membrane factor (OMF) lipoprotein
MKSPLLKRSAPLLAALILAGCVSYSGITPQSTPVAAADLNLSNAAIQWPGDHEWEILHDPVLNDLMKQALEKNPTIKIARGRLSKVDAMVKAADANRLPDVSINASVTPERFTENYIYPPPYAGSIYSTNLLMVDAKYEFDFWGKNRDLIAAAISNEKAAQAEIQSAQLLIETSVAKSYFTLARSLEQKKILERTLAQREELFNLRRQLLTAGLDTKQETQITRQGLPAIREDIIRMDEQISLSRNALAALIGKGPDATQNIIASLPANVSYGAPATVPAELIGRRADISAARDRVIAAGKLINATKTEFYPNVNITAFAGFSSLGFAHWLDGSSRDYGVGPAISLPIFDGGRLRADLSSKTAEYDIAVESYNQTLIEAVHDVADQLTSLRSLEQQQKQQAELLQNAQSVYDIAQQREKAGLVSHSAVLGAETTLLTQRSAAIDMRTRAVELNINLIRALGGGFNETAMQNHDDQSTASNLN